MRHRQACRCTCVSTDVVFGSSLPGLCQNKTWLVWARI
jgi:hypothetical protein